MNDLTETVTYERICGTVASLLFLFARIENETRDIIALARGADSLAGLHGARGTLRVWWDLLRADREARPYEALLADQLWAQIQEPLEVRNGICHGLMGAFSSRGDEPATLTWRMYGGTNSKTYDELQAMFAWLSKIPQAMSMISHAVGARDVAELRSLPDRDFWTKEFGIEFD